MRIPNATHEARPWRIHEVVPDFILEDVWALPTEGSAQDFETLVQRVVTLDPATEAESLPARWLWQLRDKLGSWFGLGRISAAEPGRLQIPGTDEKSLRDRLPDGLRGTTAGVEFRSLPFTPLYRTDNEFAAEVSNQTVHGVMHLVWVDQGDGRYQGQMAVYVKPRGPFGTAYMALIRPFRRWIVYPALTRQVEREWGERASWGSRRGR